MKAEVPDQLPALESLGRVHFIGIGGAGLSGIARIMVARGVVVSGSDAADSSTLQGLAALGVRVHVGHRAQQVVGCDTVVVSTAVKEDNPEVVSARAAGLTIVPRSVALAAVMSDRKVIAVAGTHGKTTTTSLLTTALLKSGAAPSYAIGGDLLSTGTNAQWGTGDLFVAEADESDGAFLVYSPYAAVITNVEADHLDNYGTEEAYHEAFEQFLGRIDPDGFLVCIVDDPGAERLAALASGRGLRVIAVSVASEATTSNETAADSTVGVGEDHYSSQVCGANMRFTGSQSSFTVLHDEVDLGQITLQIPGRHYVLDALAALAAGLETGCDFAALKAGLESFSGTKRRMERKGERAGVLVYDSYAHHPQEIAGDLLAARSVAGDGRVLVVFQPHMVSRTKIFAAQMGQALGLADVAAVLDVYVAREEPEPGVDASLVAGHIPLPSSEVLVAPPFDEVAGLIARRALPGDLIITLGAGDVTTLGPAILAELAAL